MKRARLEVRRTVVTDTSVGRSTGVSQGHEDLACALKEIRQYCPMQEPLGDPWRRRGVLILATKQEWVPGGGGGSAEGSTVQL